MKSEIEELKELADFFGKRREIIPTGGRARREFLRAMLGEMRALKFESFCAQTLSRAVEGMIVSELRVEALKFLSRTLGATLLAAVVFIVALVVAGKSDRQEAEANMVSELEMQSWKGN